MSLCDCVDWLKLFEARQAAICAGKGAALLPTSERTIYGAQIMICPHSGLRLVAEQPRLDRQGLALMLRLVKGRRLTRLVEQAESANEGLVVAELHLAAEIAAATKN